MKKINLSSILIAFCLIFAIFSVFVWYSSATNNDRKNLKKDIASVKSDVIFYQNAKKDYTATKIENDISNSKINIVDKMNRANSLITDSFRRVYSETKDEQAYSSLKSNLSPLGKDLSSILINLSAPTVNQTGKAIYPYDTMTGIKISFGKYDLSTQTMPCLVLVDWESPTVEATTTGVKADDRKTRTSGKDFFILNYNLKDDSLAVKDYQHSVNN